MSTLQVNAPFPSFSLPAVRESEQITLANEDLAGRPAILFFYPKDATCGCTVEVCSFRDLHEEFARSGVEVVGVSRDSIGSHRKFIDNQSLPFALLSDTDRKLAEACGLLRPKTMYGKPVVGSARTTFALDSEGVVRKVWNDVQPAGHAAEVLAWCRENFTSA